MSTYTSTGLILTKNKTIYDNRANKISETNYLNPASSTGALTKTNVRNRDAEIARLLDENGENSFLNYDGR